MFGCFFTFAKLGCFVKKYFYFFNAQNLGAVAADLLYKSMSGLCLMISRAARCQPKPALNNNPSLCVYYDLYEFKLELASKIHTSSDEENSIEKISKFFYQRKKHNRSVKKNKPSN